MLAGNYCKSVILCFFYYAMMLCIGENHIFLQKNDLWLIAADSLGQILVESAEIRKRQRRGEYMDDFENMRMYGLLIHNRKPLDSERASKQ